MGDHYILVEGSIEGERQLAFIDTGLAGLGCTVPKSTFESVKPASAAARPGGVGGGGDVGNVVPFQASIEPLFSRLMPASWRRVIAARYFGL